MKKIRHRPFLFAFWICVMTVFQNTADTGFVSANELDSSVSWDFIIPKDLAESQHCEIVWRIPGDRKADSVYVQSGIDLRRFKGGESVTLKLWFGDSWNKLHSMRFTVESQATDGVHQEFAGLLSIPHRFKAMYSHMPTGEFDDSWLMMITDPDNRAAFLEFGFQNRVANSEQAEDDQAAAGLESKP